MLVATAWCDNELVDQVAAAVLRLTAAVQVAVGGSSCGAPHKPDAAPPEPFHDHDTVRQAIGMLERHYRCKVVVAADVGSRCWGYHRAGSDYDVHSLFVPHPSALLGVYESSTAEHIKHSFEFGAVEVNLSGISLRRALRSLSEHGTTTELLELLGSDLVYTEHLVPSQTVEAVRMLALQNCSVRRCVSALLANFEKNFRARVLGRRMIPGKYYLQYARMMQYARYILANGAWPDGHSAVSGGGGLPSELITLNEWRQQLQPGEPEMIRRNVRIEMWLLVLRRRCRRSVRGLPRAAETVTEHKNGIEEALNKLHREALSEAWDLNLNL